MFDILSWVPDALKKQIGEELGDFVTQQAEKWAGEQVATTLRGWTEKGQFQKSVNAAIQHGIERFGAEYRLQDEDLTDALLADRAILQSANVQRELMALIRRPGAWLGEEREKVLNRFEDILPKRINRERVDKAIAFLLRCIVEELWSLPGTKEIREVYGLQFQKITAESAHEQVALIRQQIEATHQLTAELRQAFLQLTSGLEKNLLTAPVIASLPRPKPYNNLPRPDYSAFVGRETELNWIRDRLSPTDRAWQIAITGIGGVGKSALALRIAHEYRQRYDQLKEEERFGAIIWISAKEEVLTAQGKQQSSLPEMVLRTLEDVYTIIAQTLDREDITRAQPDERGHLVQKALQEQRTLLVMDNLESVNDERVRPFLRNLPAPTKAIITSREWMDVADVLQLKGLSPSEADLMMTKESNIRGETLESEFRKRIYDLTSGLPLPIKLAIARLSGGESTEAVIRWLGDAQGDLPEYCIQGQAELAKKRDLNTWKLLLACSLFDRSAGASRKALTEIAGLSIADCDAGLAQLQRLFLINHMTNDRFWALPIVQRYAKRQLLEDEDNQLISRWLNWLSEFAQRMANEVEWKVELISEFGMEYANILTALRWCRDQKIFGRLGHLAEGAWHYAYVTGSFYEMQEIVDAAKEAADAVDDENLAGRTYLQYARIAQTFRESHDVVERHLHKAEVIAKKFSNFEDLGEIWATRVSEYRIQSTKLKKEKLDAEFNAVLEKAIYWISEIYKTWKTSKNPHLKFLASLRLSEIEEEKRNFDQAIKWLELAAGTCKEFQWTRVWGTLVLGNRGSIYLKQKKYDKAEETLLQALEFCTKWELRRHIAHNKARLARLYLYTNKIQLGCQFSEEASDLYERIGLISAKNDTKNFLRDFLKGEI